MCATSFVIFLTTNPSIYLLLYKLKNGLKQFLEFSVLYGSSVRENYVLTLSGQINGEWRRRLPAKPLTHDRTIVRRQTDRRDVLQKNIYIKTGS